METRLSIKSWAQFDRVVRNRDMKLLAQLSAYPEVVLVAGCQRSGTTAVTRILRAAMGNSFPQFSNDDELDAALILCGARQFETVERCCFQTTFVNDHYKEYFEHDRFRLIWILRRPEAVVRSMIHNWRRGALNRLFRACGKHALNSAERSRFDRFGSFGFRRLEKACFSYAAKTAQVHEIARSLGPERLYILDYDELLAKRDTQLPALFQFASVPFDERFLQQLKQRVPPANEQFIEAERKLISATCDAAYDRAVELANTQNSACGTEEQ